MKRNAPSYAEVARPGSANDGLPNGDTVVGKRSQGDVKSTKAKQQTTQKPNTEGTATQAKDVASLVLLWTLTLTLIFGGCCSNVYVLEAIIKDEPDSGLLITFVQFVMAALFTWPANASLSNPPSFLQERVVPLRRQIPNVLLFFMVNMMNNFAFGFKISVPIHIILRSGGSVMTLVVGWAWGKKYSKGQIFGVIMLTAGVIVAAMADAQSKGKMDGDNAAANIASFNAGLAILFVAQLLSAIMGVYVQNTYAVYGSQWRENLFYCHFLSLPLFGGFLPSFWNQFQRLLASPPLTIAIPGMDLRQPITSQLTLLWNSFITMGGAPKGAVTSITMPIHVFTLLLDGLTQYACIRGVNLLAARTSALGVTIVLNLRKLISLFLSIWLFGNTLPPGVVAGAAIVFTGASVYAWGGPAKKPLEKPKKA